MAISRSIDLRPVSGGPFIIVAYDPIERRKEKLYHFPFKNSLTKGACKGQGCTTNVTKIVACGKNPMLSKEEFIAEASAAYEKWLAEDPMSKDGYNFEKDFEAWFLELGRKLLEGDRSKLGANRNKKKNPKPFWMVGTWPSTSLVWPSQWLWDQPLYARFKLYHGPRTPL